MKRKSILQVSLIAALVLGTAFNLSTGMTFKSMEMFEEEFYQSTVPCKDTENSGSGTLRARICGGDCDWDDYKLPATDGTCIIDDPVIE